MQKIYKKKIGEKRGFSLIELSMVLVIIGVLIVGISSGKSFVKSAKVSSARSATLSSQIVNIPGMVAWYETSTKDSFRNSQSIDGSQLTTWYNIAPSGLLFKNNLGTFGTPSTGTRVANTTYQDDGINDIPTVRTDVAGRISLTNFSGSSLSTSTVVVVFRPIGTLDDTTAKIVADSGSGVAYAIGIKRDAVSLNVTDSASTTFVSNVPYVLMVDFNGINSQVFVNSITSLGTVSAGSLILDGFTIGSNRSGATGIDAEVSEAIVYDRTLTVSQRRDVMSYLSKKYKIAVAGL
jgi:prepilin-type N-terminal cleavage/methylation domain-containing protein